MLKKIKFRLMEASRTRKLNQFIRVVDRNYTILDVGVSYNEYSPFDNFLEKNYTQKKKITGLTIDKDLNPFKKSYPDIPIFYYNGSIFPFKNEAFHVVYNNAVIEHVGGIDKQILFLKEMLRTSSEIVFFTTPYKYFPVEMHTNMLLLHFLPKQIFDRILLFFNKKWATGDYMHLLSIKQIREIIKSANPIVKYKIRKNRTLGFVSTLSIIIYKK